MKKFFDKHKLSVRLLVIMLASVSMTTLTSCGLSAVQPDVKIKPQNDISAGKVTISVDVKNFALGSAASDGPHGQIIYYMDASVPTYYEHSAVSKAGTFAVSSDTAHVWNSVTPGEHKFSVQLVDNNNSPLPIPVVSSVIVNVGAPEGSPTLSISNPPDASTLTPGSILVQVDVGSFIVSQNDMGVILRQGEGHLIYYIDETPPVDAGVPATTATSIVSTDFSHLWKAINAGQHIFSVQLVNNDDTPLKTPVVASVNITVAA